MSIFARPHYTSEATQFLDKLKQDRPALDAQQRAGRALLWDRALDRNALAEWQEASVPQQPYVYQSKADS